MHHKSRATMEKNNRERAKKQKRLEKLEHRRERREGSPSSGELSDTP